MSDHYGMNERNRMNESEFSDGVWDDVHHGKVLGESGLD